MVYVYNLKASPDLRIAAIYYFLSAFIVLMIAFIGYFAMHRMEFYKHWSRITDENNKRKLVENNNEKQSVPYKKIIKKVTILVNNLNSSKLILLIKLIAQDMAVVILHLAQLLQHSIHISSVSIGNQTDE